MQCTLKTFDEVLVGKCHYTPMAVSSIVLKSGLLTVTHQLRENNLRSLGCKLVNSVRPIMFHWLLMPSLASLLWALISKEHWIFHGLTLTYFAHDDDDFNFLCCEKWVAWLSMLLFTLDNNRDKIIHHHCCQWSLFYRHKCRLQVRTVP